MPPTLPLSRPLPAGATTSFTSTTSTTSSNASQTLHTHTHRRSPWTYIHLRLHTSPPTTTATTLDALTARQHLSAALRSYLGAHGAATAVDILRVDADGGDVWIRVPREDGAGVVAAVGGWVGSSAAGGTGGEEEVMTGWVVKGWGDWLGGVVLGRGGGGGGGDGGADVFGDGR